MKFSKKKQKISLACLVALNIGFTSITLVPVNNVLIGDK